MRAKTIKIQKSQTESRNRLGDSHSRTAFFPLTTVPQGKVFVHESAFKCLDLLRLPPNKPYRGCRQPEPIHFLQERRTAPAPNPRNQKPNFGNGSVWIWIHPDPVGSRRFGCTRIRIHPGCNPIRMDPDSNPAGSTRDANPTRWIRVHPGSLNRFGSGCKRFDSRV